MPSSPVLTTAPTPWFPPCIPDLLVLHELPCLVVPHTPGFDNSLDHTEGQWQAASLGPDSQTETREEELKPAGHHWESVAEAVRIPFASDNPAVQNAATSRVVVRSEDDSWHARVGILVPGAQGRASYLDDRTVHRGAVAGALDWASRDSLVG